MHPLAGLVAQPWLAGCPRGAAWLQVQYLKGLGLVCTYFIYIYTHKTFLFGIYLLDFILFSKVLINHLRQVPGSVSYCCAGSPGDR